MEVSSLSANAYASQSAQSERSQQARQAQQVERQAERQAPPAKEPVEKKEDAPKPVANAQGQKTGQVISVTA